MEQMPLFERLGGRDGVRRLTACIVDNHFANPAIATRFAAAAHSRDQMVDSVTEFFCTGVLLHRPERRAHLRRPSGARRPHRDEHQ